ncbi:MAG: hypothetical protein IPO35_17245 [Uliginosibacterium sp.]|nr:hypothetical protein [Uliginosibacterium sp.]
MKEAGQLIDAAVAAGDGASFAAIQFPALKPHGGRAGGDAPLITVDRGAMPRVPESVSAIRRIGQPDDVANAAGTKAKGQGSSPSFLCLNHYAQYPASHQRCQGLRPRGLGLEARPG